MEELRNSMKKLQEDYQFSPEESADYSAKIIGKRLAKYKAALIEKYGVDLLSKVAKKYGKLSEEKVWQYAQSHAKELTTKEIKMFFNKDGNAKEMVKNDLRDELPDPEWSESEGAFIPQKKIKVKPKVAETVLSEEDFQEMPNSKLREFLISHGKYVDTGGY